MKSLLLLEKNKYFWSLLILCVIFFVLRLPSLIEPYWYGDEGIYQVIGQALNKGQLLYQDIWDNKPPMLYWLYASVNGDQNAMRIMSLTFGLAAVAAFFLLSRILFKSHRISIFTTSIYVLLFGTPLIEGNIANAENFMQAFILTSGLLVFYLSQGKIGHIQKTPKLLFLAGAIAGFAFLFKIVALFDAAAFTLFLVFLMLNKITKRSLQNAFFSVLPFLAGFVLPFGLTLLYFALQGTFILYLQSAFSQNVDYVGFENYLLGVPQGLLIFKTLLLGIAVSVLFIKRRSLAKETLFLCLWIVFALFSASFSGRPYTHYLLVLLPSFCLLIGYLFYAKKLPQKKFALGAILAISIYFAFTFPLFGIGKTFAYYQNALAFLSNQRDIRTYQAFFDPETPRDYILATFIKNNVTPQDKVFSWGDSAQIYALSETLPPYKYAVAYHVLQDPQLLVETEQMINEVRPKYIITLPETQPLPFSVPLYIIRFNIEGAIIYERSI